MKRLFAWLGAEYGYTPRQSAQLLGLLCLTLALLLVPVGYRAWLLSRPMEPIPALEIVSLADSLDGHVSYDRPQAGRAESKPVVLRLHRFDPNQADELEWQELGTPAWLARRIGNYRAKGGQFRRVEDVGRIYDFPPELLAQLGPYMVFPATVGKAYRQDFGDRPKLPAKAARTYAIVDLNTADSAALEGLPELGPGTARAILQYRNRLGGFVDPAQVYELYNQDSLRTAVFLPYLKADPVGLAGLNINALARRAKLSHPYLPRNTVRLITAFVNQHGNLARPEQLLEHRLIDSASYWKVLPYLRF